MALLLGRMPPGTVEMLLSAIGTGMLPVPSPDTMDEWMEIYRAAKRGELAVTFPDGGSPMLEFSPAPPPAPPAPPPRPREVESEADFLVRLRQVRLEAEAAMEARKNAG